jgi:hypothetical protein
MKNLHFAGLLPLVFLVPTLFLGGCASAKPVPKPAPLQGKRMDDGSRCSSVGRDDREVVETNSPASTDNNVRRVYGYFGSGEERARILVCREVDTNFDGVKDLVRVYDDKGEKLTEQADADYDGKIDTWITFAGSYPGKIELDTNRDGEPDQTRFYVGGVLARLQRDVNGDGESDRFEVYRDGHLDRIGVDEDYDGQVDRWDRDEEAIRKQLAEADRVKRESAQATENPASAAP